MAILKNEQIALQSYPQDSILLKAERCCVRIAVQCAVHTSTECFQGQLSVCGKRRLTDLKHRIDSFN